MSKASVQTNLDLKDLLKNAAQLRIKDLESFTKELNALITRKRSKNKSYREAKLLSLHNQSILPKEKRNRFQELLKKMEMEEMTETERVEFLILTKKDEKLRNERLRILIELSQLKGISLPQLMNELGLMPPPVNA